MIPNTNDRSLESNGVKNSAEFGISLDDSAHIMSILRDQVYTDKVLAVIREYSANAWDAHRDSGKPDLPIKVTIPTAMDPTLIIRDFGHGLSPESVFQIYTKYGRSTKRDSDVSVGMLGIGSKSGFAYSDTFTITSYHGGKKRMYIAVLDQTNKGLINLMHEEDSDETGVEIKIAVRPQDIHEFETKAKEFFKHFNPRPTINIEIPPARTNKYNLKNGIIYDNGQYEYTGNSWYAVMGCVPYRINLNQIRGRVPNFIDQLSGVLYFNIGDVQINASREELKYGDSTRAALVDKFNALIDEHVKTILDDIKRDSKNVWERRIKAQALSLLRVGVPKDCQDLVNGYIQIKNKMPATISVHNGKFKSDTITVHSSTRLIIKDDGRAREGFGFGSHDYIVRKNDKIDLKTLKADLDKMIQDLNIDGIPVVLASSLPWSSTRVAGTFNIKHKLKVFKFKPSGQYAAPYSRYWEAEDISPKAEDVYVMIDNFKSNPSIYDMYESDRRVAEYFNKTIPTVYGYKYSEKNIVGIPYETWRKNFYKSLIDDNIKAEYQEYRWSELFDNYSYKYDTSKVRSAIYDLEKQLGKTHPVVDLYNKHYNAWKKVSGKKGTHISSIIDKMSRVISVKEFGDDEAAAAYSDLQKKYPLIGLPYNIYTRDGSAFCDEWAHYFKLVDNKG